MAAMIISAVSCGGKTDEKHPADSTAKNDRLQGDSCVYGLACDGCTDSILVLLPEDASDLIRYEIIDARHSGKVFGHPKIGDRIALLIDTEDSLVAELVVDMEQLKGTWCYIVKPQMRALENMSKRLQKRMERDMPDSVKSKLMVPREVGFTLSSHYTAHPVGMAMAENSLKNDSPVVYPEVKVYSEWHIWNGQLVLAFQQDKPNESSKQPMTARNDTATILFLGPDTLSLGFSDGTQQGYYRKK